MRDITDPDTLHDLADAAIEIGTLLGNAFDWDGAADYLDAIAEILAEHGLPDPSSWTVGDYAAHARAHLAPSEPHPS